MLNEFVLSKDLCCYCGACSFICPIHNYELIDEKAKARKECHNECHKCFDSCPQIPDEYKEKKSKNEVFERYYLAQTTDSNVLAHVASGGAITTLLTGLVEEKMVDAVVVTQFGKETPWSPNTILTDNADEILKAAFSKYAMTPALGVLHEISEKKYDKVAFMGLPCHIESISMMKKLVSKNPNSFSKEVKNALNAIKYLVGLWCGNNFRVNGTKEFIQYNDLEPEKVSEVGYVQDKGPLRFYVMYEQQKRILSFQEYMGFLLTYCITNACENCSRCYAYDADLSIGGMNSPGLRWSGIICHTEVGEKLLLYAKDKKYIHLKQMSDSGIMSIKMKKIYKDKRLGK